ncbi:PREDICTED: uncharacterized protein LOC108574357 [Habropoda laboriosa]|uniref:uncharacterized protein LOC108574357 n=1 Tax=Habropoda laboriosa TaxID=597456 RepID=UPI00083E1FE3|nr:PREDICTED: uncharacterized protein LOC108574357 [Habropoda laboriosa]
MCTNINNESSRPVTPSEEDCCHSGCDPCIFDVHKKLLEEYEKKGKQNVQTQKKKNILNLYSYKNFVVVNMDETSECYILLFLKYQEETKIHLIGGFQSILQIPLKKELQLLSDYWNFKCTLHISQLQNDFFSLHGLNVKSGRIDKESVCETLENHMTNATLILICGTRQFNSSVEQWARNMNYTHIHVFE